MEFSITQRLNIAGSSAVIFSKNGKYIITGSSDNKVKMFELNTAKMIHRLPPTEPEYSVTAIAISSDYQLIAFSSSNSVIRIWDRATNTYIHTLNVQGGIISSLIFTPDGQTIISSFNVDTKDSRIIFWDVNTGNKIYTLGQGHFNGVSALVLSSDGAKLASVGGARDSTVRIWNVNTKAIFKFIEMPDNVSCISFSPDNQTIACGFTYLKPLSIFDVNTGGNIIRTNKRFRASCIAFSPDGLHIVAGDLDSNEINYFDVGTLRNILTLKLDKVPTTMVMFDLTGKKLMTYSSISKLVIIGEQIERAAVDMELFFYIRYNGTIPQENPTLFDMLIKYFSGALSFKTQDTDSEVFEQTIRYLNLDNTKTRGENFCTSISKGIPGMSIEYLRDIMLEQNKVTLIAYNNTGGVIKPLSILVFKNGDYTGEEEPKLYLDGMCSDQQDVIRRGFGSQLLTIFIDAAKKVGFKFIELASASDKATETWKKKGFERQHGRRDDDELPIYSLQLGGEGDKRVLIDLNHNNNILVCDETCKNLGPMPKDIDSLNGINNYIDTKLNFKINKGGKKIKKYRTKKRKTKNLRTKKRKTKKRKTK